MGSDFLAMALEGPNAIQDIVAGSRQQEAYGIGNILVDFQPFLAYIRGPKINYHSAASHETEFDEFPNKSHVHHRP